MQFQITTYLGTIGLFVYTTLQGYGQSKDALSDPSVETGMLEEIVTTATRTEQSLQNIPMPVTLIKGADIQRMGALRLNEVLAEQTGIQVIQDHGSGVQMQGLNTDYVLILIDGEPVIGRTKGNIDLTRLVVGNIDRIEIVKGPSSSLFGSEAMGGVINIITKKGQKELAGSLRARYRRYNTLDLSAEAGKQHQKIGWYAFANRMSSDGYFAKGATSSITKTIAPFTGYTASGKINYRISPALEVVVNARFFNEDQRNNKQVEVNNAFYLIGERTNRQDLSLTPTVYWTPATGRKFQIRNYITSFRTRSLYEYQNNNEVYDDSYFKQFFNRSEIQYDHEFNKRHITTLGIGNILEGVDATRYDNSNTFNQFYGFAQHQWHLLKHINITGGFRYDKHNQYADRFSPKLAAGWHISQSLSIQASVAGGYKAPTFEQLLLNFPNPTVGYTVVGTNVAARAIRKLEQEGQIQQILIDPTSIGAISAERSLAYNMGFKFQPGKQFTLQANFFRNNISDMIDFNTVAIKTNQGAIYSYFNRNQVFTQGVEVNTSLKLPYNIELSAGLQYLDAKDVTVWNEVKAGKVYYRDDNNLDHKVAPAAYGGLYNRSKFTGNIKVHYANTRYDFDIALRSVFRSRFGTGLDVNGNGILDDDREYTSGYQLWNLSLRKFVKKFGFEAGVNNLFAVHTPFDPTTPGQNWYAGISYKF